MGEVEIVPRIERRRKWTEAEKAALLAEVEAEGGKVKVVARRHRISESLIYNWRSAWKMATAAMRSPSVEFVPVSVVDGGDDVGRPTTPSAMEQPSSTAAPSEERTGRIEIALPTGVRIHVDESICEKALTRILRALKGSM